MNKLILTLLAIVLCAGSLQALIRDRVYNRNYDRHEGGRGCCGKRSSCTTCNKGCDTCGSNHNHDVVVYE